MQDSTLRRASALLAALRRGGAAAASCAALAACAGTAAADTPLARQRVMFAPSVAAVGADGGWTLFVQGRVYAPADGSRRRQALVDLLARQVGADRADPLFRTRAGFFVSDSAGEARVAVALGERVVTLPPTDAAGVFTGEIALGADEAARLARDGSVSIETPAAPERPQRFGGRVALVPEEGVTVVTDMDDTIKETRIADRAEAKANTFVRPFRAVAGMPELYRAWQAAAGEGGASLHFHVVSAGPWQFHEPLRRFTEEAGFPAFTWDMRSVRITRPSVLVRETVLADPQRLHDFKVDRIRALLKRFPRRHVVLVGDSGERDPEVYATIAAEFGDRVDAVFIRNVTGEDRAAARYARLFTGAVAARLRVFGDPQELPRRLEAPR